MTHRDKCPADMLEPYDAAMGAAAQQGTPPELAEFALAFGLMLYAVKETGNAPDEWLEFADAVYANATGVSVLAGEDAEG